MFSGLTFARRADRRNRPGTRQDRRRRQRKLLLEILEDRRLLANVLWIASSSGTWNTAANWIDLSNGTSHVPTPSDVAVFDTTQSYGATSGTNSNAAINVAPNIAGVWLANYSGTITQNTSMTLTVGASGYSQASGTFVGGANLDVNGNFTLSGGSFTAPGTGRTFSVAGNFSASGGTFAHNSGTVTFDALSGTQTLDSGGATFNAVRHSGAGTLQLVTNDLTTTGTFTQTGTGTFDINGRACSLNTLTLTGGTIADTNATPGQITSSNAFDLQFGTVSAKLTGGVGLNKTTTGTVTLSGANSYTGPTQVERGVLRVLSSTALGTSDGTTSVLSGATLQIHGTGLSLAEDLNALAGTLTTTADFGVSGKNTWTGKITLASGATIKPTADQTLTVSGQVTGTGPLTLADVGVLVLSNTSPAEVNNYTGGTLISSGRLKVGAAGVIPDDVVTVNGYFDLNGISEGIGALQGSSSGRVMSTAVGTATLTVGLDNGDGNFSGNIQDGTSDPSHKLALTKTGTGTQTLSGVGAGSDNSYTGQTYVENGTLALNKTPPAYPNVRIAVSSHVVIVGDGTNAAVLKLLQRDQISEFADVEVRAGATFLLNGNNETFDALNGVGLVTNNSATGATLTLGYDGDSPGSFLGVMEDGTGGGRLSLTKMGDGTQSLGGSAPNTFTGTTTVTGGTLVLNKTPGVNALGGNITIGDTHDTDTLQLGASNQIPDTAAVTFTSGAVGNNGVFDLNGHDETVGKLISIGDRYHNITNTAVGTSALTVNAASGDDSTFSGTVTDGGSGKVVALTKTGLGTLTLRYPVTTPADPPTNTYSGETDIQEGILALAAVSVNNIPASTLITVRDGALLDVTGLNSNTIALANGQTLQGHGRVEGQVNARSGSTVSPGIFPDPPGTDPGDLDTAGATFQAASTFLVDLEGLEAGKDYDQLRVEGAVTIQAGAVLQTPGTFLPSAGDEFVIIDNDGTGDAVTLGAGGLGFNNLPEGGIYDINFRGTGLQAVISYQGRDGNDVVITFFAPTIELVKLGTFQDENGDGNADVGETIRYQFTVTNTGLVDLYNVSVTDAKLAVSGGPLAVLAAGAADATTFTGSYTITQADIDAETLHNEAVATGTSPGGLDATDTAAADTSLPAAPSIELVKVGTFQDENGDGNADVGETIRYAFTVRNTGNQTLTEVTLADAVGGVAIVGDPIPTLPAGAEDSTTFTGSYTITQADIAAGTFHNEALATGHSPGGPDVTGTGSADTPLPPWFGERFDFNGFYAYTAEGWIPVPPFLSKEGSPYGWLTLPAYYYERNYPELPRYSSPEKRLEYDGQSTDYMGGSFIFEVDVMPGKQYEVMILTGDMLWNHDREQFQVYDANGVVPPLDPDPADPRYTQVVDTWGAGPPDGSGVTVGWGGGTANPAAGYYRWLHFTTDVIVESPTRPGVGTVRMRMTDRGGYDPATTISAMDVRAVERVGPLTITRSDPADTATGTPPSFTALPTDGVTVDTYQGTGAPPDTKLTVTVSAGLSGPYATITTDVDVTMFGGQVMSDSSGNFTFSVRRPAILADISQTTENWTITVEEYTGLYRGTVLQPYTTPSPAEPLRFDFGVSGSPAQTYLAGGVTKHFLPVVPQTIYSGTRGYGWLSRVAGVDRKDKIDVNPETGSDLRRDLNYAKDATFRVDLPDGMYSLRIYHSNPKYYGTVSYVADNFDVLIEEGEAGATTYHVDSILAGRTTIWKTTSPVRVTNGALTVRLVDRGGQDGNFVIAGLDLSAGVGLPDQAPLLAAGDPRDGGAAAISLAQLQPVVSEAAAQWTAAGLTPQQAATLANVQFAVVDLGGAYLGLANPATNTVRIDDDAAMIGWGIKDEGGRIKDEGGRMKDEVPELRSLNPEPQSLSLGIDLLTVVLHEIGHLLGYEHSAEGLMAPVLGASPLHPSSFLPHPSSLIPHPSSFILSPASRPDDAFAELGRGGSEESSLVLPEAQVGDVLAAATLKASEEAALSPIPRRSRLPDKQELDEYFAQWAGLRRVWERRGD